MTDRDLVLRLISTTFRRIERYVLTVKPDEAGPGCVYYSSDHDCGLSGAHITMMTPEQFLSGVPFVNPRQIRLDAVTVPTFPVERTDEILALLSPGLVGQSGNALPSTPGGMIMAFTAAWYETLKKYNIEDTVPGLTEIRANFGQPAYGADVAGHALFSTDPIRNMMHVVPFAGYGFNNQERTPAHCDDAIDDCNWMRRIIFELLPVPMYQRIIFGNQNATRQGASITEETAYAPIDVNNPGSTDAAALVLREEINALNMALGINTTGSCISTRLVGDMPAARPSSRWYISAGSGNSCVTGNGDGLFRMFDRFVILQQDSEIAWSAKQMTDSNLEGDSILSKVHRRLVEPHNDDAASDILKHAWDRKD